MFVPVHFSDFINYVLELVEVVCIGHVVANNYTIMTTLLPVLEYPSPLVLILLFSFSCSQGSFSYCGTATGRGKTFALWLPLLLQ